MPDEGALCGFVNCGLPAVGSAAVRGTVWFATHSRMSPTNGDEPHWEVGGFVAPVDITCTIHVCTAHNVVNQEEHSHD